MHEQVELSAEEVRAYRDLVNGNAYADVAHWVAVKLRDNTSPKGDAFCDQLQKALRRSWRTQISTS
jgi:hypothetical protein